MTESLNKLKELLGNERFNEIVNTENTIGEEPNSTVNLALTNAKEVLCECSTLIMRPSTGRLVLPTDSMQEVEKELKLLRLSDKLVKNIAQGCYWLVDDMFKFENIAYTKPMDQELFLKCEKIWNIKQNEQQASQDNTSSSSISNSEPSFQELFSDGKQSNINLRYLVCADCNTGPLGWHDGTANESYLYVW